MIRILPILLFSLSLPTFAQEPKDSLPVEGYTFVQDQYEIIGRFPKGYFSRIIDEYVHCQMIGTDMVRLFAKDLPSAVEEIKTLKLSPIVFLCEDGTKVLKLPLASEGSIGYTKVNNVGGSVTSFCLTFPEGTRIDSGHPRCEPAAE